MFFSRCGFQSHYGLILSCTAEQAHSEEQNNLFQSHYGLILSRNSKEDNRSSRTFQSHYGLILSISVLNPKVL